MDKNKKAGKHIVQKNIIPKKSRHIRWSSHESPDNFDMEYGLVRYFFVIVDDSESDRRRTLSKILSQLSEVDSRLIKIDKFEGKIEESKWGCLFAIYDSIVSHTVLNLGKLGRPVRKDDNLYQRKVLNVEDYVSNLYNVDNFKRIS